MVKAYPVNTKGEQTGPIQSFSDEQWRRLTSIKGCCFVELKTEVIKKKVVELMPVEPTVEAAVKQEPTGLKKKQKHNQNNK